MNQKLHEAGEVNEVREKNTSWEEWKEEMIFVGSDHLKSEIEKAEYLCKSPIEKIAYGALIGLYETFGLGQLQIIPQFKIENYTVDFLVKYEPLFQMEKFMQIVIECDGHDWHERTKEQAAKDRSRDRRLLRLGYLVLRYTGSEIVDDPYTLQIEVKDLIISWFPKLSEKVI